MLTFKNRPTKSSGNFSILIIAFFLCFIVSNSYASSVQSGEMVAVKSLGNNQYFLQMAAYRNCDSAQYNAWTNTVKALCTSNASAGFINHTLAHLPYYPNPNGIDLSVSFTASNLTFVNSEVSEFCSSVLDPNNFSKMSSCRGGNTSGIMRFDYTAIITLSPCNSWYLQYQAGNMNTNEVVNLDSGIIDRYYAVEINTLNFPNNSIPARGFYNHQTTRACIGQKQEISLGYQDFNGDSLRYVPTCLLAKRDTCAHGATGYGGPGNGGVIQSSRISDFDTLTGHFSFNPTTAGKYTYGFWVEEYDVCTGNLKGKVHFEKSIIASACTNSVPQEVGHQVYGLNKLGNNHYQVSMGDTFEIVDTILDVDKDTLLYWSNFGQITHGGRVNVSRIDTNKHIISFKGLISNPKLTRASFYYKVSDDNCDNPGLFFKDYQLSTQPSVVIEKYGLNVDTKVLCSGDSIQIRSNLGSKVKWRTIYGPSLNDMGPNRNISYADTSTKRNAWFWPKQTCLLELSVDSFSNCTGTIFNLKDTLKVTVAKNFGITIMADSAICQGDSVLMQVFTDSAFNYSYSWNSTAILSKYDTSYSQVTPSYPVLSAVEVKSDSGCIRNAEHMLNVYPNVLLPKIITSSDSICEGTQKVISIDYTNMFNLCGVKPIDNCHKSIITNDGVGVSSNPSTGTGIQLWPNPFSKAEPCARQQFLYTNAELKNMGLTNGGILSSISFYVDSLPLTANSIDIELLLKCTRNSWMSGAFHHGLKKVHDLKRINITLGWNKIVFDSAYAVHKDEGILLEVRTLSNNTGLSPSLKYRTASYNSSISGYSSTSCFNTQFISLGSYYRLPVIRLDVCTVSTTSDSTYKFNWSPGNLFSDSTARNPNLTGEKNITYRLELEDSVSGCRNELQFSVLVKEHPKVKIKTDTVFCPNKVLSLEAVISKTLNGGKYKWYPDSVIPVDSTRFTNYTVDKDRVIKIEYADTAGCYAEDSLFIKVIPKTPTPLLTPSFLCKQDTIVNLKSVSGTGRFLGPGIKIGTNNMDVSSGQIWTVYNLVHQARYRFIETNAPCPTDTFFTIPIYPLFDTILATPAAYCENSGKHQVNTRHIGKGNWSGSFISSSGEFDVNAAGLGVHSIKVDSVGNCGNSGSFKIHVAPNPVVNFQTKDYCELQDCVRALDTLQGTPSGGKWIGNAWITGKNNIGEVNLCDLNAKKYKVQYEYTDSIGCMDTLTKTFVVHPYPSVTFQAKDYCTGPSCVTKLETLSANISGGEWESPIWGSGLDSSGVFDVCDLEERDYIVSYRYIDSKGCEGSAKDTIRVDTHNISIPLLASYTYCDKGSVRLNAGSDTALIYKWNTGDTVQSLSFNGGQAGVYTVTVSEPNNALCFATKTSKVTYDEWCLGIQPTEANKIRVFPNPTSNFLKVEIANDVYPAAFHIIDASGALVFSSSLDTGSFEINTSNFSDGVYLLEIVFGEQSFFHRFVVSH